MIEAIAIVGVCAPERRRYAEQTAQTLRARLDVLQHARPHGSHVRIHLPPPRTGAVAGTVRVTDVGTDVDLLHAMQALADEDDVDRLEVVCVVDARHMRDDLRDDHALHARAAAGDPRGDVGARARQAATALELATSIVLVNWSRCETSDLAELMALASHLNPTARVRLSRSPRDDLGARRGHLGQEVPLWERAGWVRALNGDHDPYMTDRRVVTTRYEQLRPFHPGRLVRVLDEIEEGRCGTVLRSAGFCRLATRAAIPARWEHVGSAMWIDPLAPDDGAATVGQDIAFTGLSVRPSLLHALLDEAVVTDAEFARGPEHWRSFADPLPGWPTARPALDLRDDSAGGAWGD